MRIGFRQESGSALIVALMVTFLLLAVGLATVAWADGGFGTSRQERERESSFNLAEAVLQAQIYRLSRDWPKSTTPFPALCPNAAQPNRCPSQATLDQTYASTDYAAGYVWNTRVQDNGGSVSSVYNSVSAAGPPPQPPYDANGDGKLWVRADTTVRGRPRRLVAKVRAQEVVLNFPRNVLTAGFFTSTNAGRKVVVNTKGKSGQAGTLAVRCAGLPSRYTTPTCLRYNTGQVSPNNFRNSYPASEALSADDRATLKALAQKNGTYYTSCPAGLPTGAVVYIESGNCSYVTGSINSAASPGLLVIERGTLYLGGNAEFYGLIYALNAPGTTPLNCDSTTGAPGSVGPGCVVSVQGTAHVYGAISVDGLGGVSVGSSAENLTYDSNVFGLVKGYGGAKFIPGSWRDLGAK